VVDDEGLLTGSPFNYWASAMAMVLGWEPAPGQVIVGDAVLVGFTPEGDTVSLSAKQLDKVWRATDADNAFTKPREERDDRE